MQRSVGVIHWDACLPRGTYFGDWALRTLAEPAFRDRLPWYTEFPAEGQPSFPSRTPEQYDEELRLAADSGIDYFAYCWYPEAAGERPYSREAFPFLREHMDELNHARKHHRNSPLKDRIGYAAIFFSMHAYGEEDLCGLTEAFADPAYHKVGGRPLVCLFGGYDADVVALLRTRGEAAGYDPYIVLFGESLPEGASGIDALSGYAVGAAGESTQALYDHVVGVNSRRVEGCGTDGTVRVVPQFSVGWDPRPRIAHPVPWTQYADTAYPPRPDAGGLALGAERLAAWIKENAPALENELLCFAWNEFEEGGYLCPTAGQDGKPDASLLQAFAKVLPRLKNA